MQHNETVAQLVERVRGGDAAAAQTLFARYSVQLSRVAERHLSDKLAARLDGADVVQSVFRTFFRRCLNGEFTIGQSTYLAFDLIDENSGLCRPWFATGGLDEPVNFCGSRAQAQRRLASFDGHLAEGDLEQEPPDLRGRVPVFCQVLELRLAGHSVADVAVTLQLSRQTVYRCLRTLAHRLERAGG
jgi:hypothetical protein